MFTDMYIPKPDRDKRNFEIHSNHKLNSHPLLSSLEGIEFVFKCCFAIETFPSNDISLQ